MPYSIRLSGMEVVALLQFKTLYVLFLLPRPIPLIRWDSLRPFSAENDSIVEPAHFTCPPLLR